ncbi:MAG: glycosyl hydrolase [Actinomycetota bacterium]
MRPPRPAALLAGVSAVMAAVAACTGLTALREAPRPAPRPAVRVPAPPIPHPAGAVLYGVASGSVPAWNKATGTRAALSVAYISMARPVPAAFMRWTKLNADGSEPVIEILPRGTTLAAVTAGRGDHWLRQLRAEITSPVVVSFAPEANGGWYSWGAQPRAFRAAWRHVHAILGTRNITWMWQMSARLLTSRAAVARYWPGGRYVQWAGLDGYFEYPRNTFRGLFGAAIRGIHAQSPVPILLSETAAGPGTGHQARNVRELFAGVRRYGLLGLIWFDKKQHRPPYHQNWRLQDSPAALAAFRAGVRRN